MLMIFRRRSLRVSSGLRGIEHKPNPFACRVVAKRGEYCNCCLGRVGLVSLYGLSKLLKGVMPTLSLVACRVVAKCNEAPMHLRRRCQWNEHCSLHLNKVDLASLCGLPRVG